MSAAPHSHAPRAHTPCPAACSCCTHIPGEEPHWIPDPASGALQCPRQGQGKHLGPGHGRLRDSVLFIARSWSTAISPLGTFLLPGRAQVLDTHELFGHGGVLQGRDNDSGDQTPHLMTPGCPVYSLAGALARAPAAPGVGVGLARGAHGTSLPAAWSRWCLPWLSLLGLGSWPWRLVASA